jgi:transposase
MEQFSGNISDKKTMLRTIKEERTSFNIDQTIYHMADSALYSAISVQELGSYCNWITHVPETLKEVKDILFSDVEWIPCIDSRYKYAVFESNYGGIDKNGSFSTLKRDIRLVLNAI